MAVQHKDQPAAFCTRMSEPRLQAACKQLLGSVHMQLCVSGFCTRQLLSGCQAVKANCSIQLAIPQLALLAAGDDDDPNFVHAHTNPELLFLGNGHMSMQRKELLDLESSFQLCNGEMHCTVHAQSAQQLGGKGHILQTTFVKL